MVRLALCGAELECVGEHPDSMPHNAERHHAAGCWVLTSGLLDWYPGGTSKRSTGAQCCSSRWRELLSSYCLQAHTASFARVHKKGVVLQGKFYEIFEMDASVAAEILDLIAMKAR